MSDLSKLVLPVKDPSTGEVTNQEFNLTGGGGAEYYLDQNVILSSSNDTTVTFTDSKITEDSVVDVYTSFGTLPFRTMSITAGSCVVTFPKQGSSLNVTVRIYVR